MTSRLKEKELSPLAAGDAAMASQRILRELVDALIQENLFGLQTRAALTECATWTDSDDFPLGEGEQYCRYPLSSHAGELVFRVKPQSGLQAFRLSRPPVFWVEQDQSRAESLDAARLMQCLVSAADPEVLPNVSGLDRFMRDLAIAEAQTCCALQAATQVVTAIQQGAKGLLAWERLAALRDRPFHPLARAKVGWDCEQYRHYSTEAGNCFGLDWLAVPNNQVIGSDGLRGMAVADRLLSPDERNSLQQAATERHIDFERYSLIPVHPWQMRHVIARELADDPAFGQCIPVAESMGCFAPTSSARSLVPVHGTTCDDMAGAGGVHVKLPLAVASLGALRILPPRYLHNGAFAQSVIAAIIEREASLQNIFLCDEKQWIGFSPAGENMLSNRSGHLTCLLREYPRPGDLGCDYLPMSAFTVMHDRGVPAYERVVAERMTNQLSAQDTVLDFFEELCDQLCMLCFTCFGYGVMPEVHGQNLVLAIERGRVKGLVLRDHDTLRIFPPWMRQMGLGDIDYVMDWGTPNSLVCLSPEELLRYFQTLGVQVNLYAIADTLSQAYEIDPAQFWRTVKHCVQRQLQNLALPVFAKAILRKALLDTPVWPARLLLTPYLVKRTQVTGMPSGLGSVPNPLTNAI